MVSSNFQKITQKKPLTRDGFLVPPVIFGTSTHGNLYRELPYETKLEVTRQWFACVETPAIDTAGKYGAGLALEMIGKTLRELDIKSDEITISDKLGWCRVPLKGTEPTFEPGVWANLKYDAEQDISGDGILRCYQKDRILLGAPYHFDLVSVHDPDEFLANGGKRQDIIDAYHSLFELKKSGEVKAVGIGSKDWRVVADIYKDIHFDWVMLACAPTVLCHPPELLEFMRQLEAERVGIINSAIFNGGFLTGGAMYNYHCTDPQKDEELFRRRDTFLQICEEENVLPVDAAVQYAMKKPGVVSVSLATSKPQKVADNVRSTIIQLPDSFFEKLKTRGVTKL